MAAIGQTRIQYQDRQNGGYCDDSWVRNCAVGGRDTSSSWIGGRTEAWLQKPFVVDQRPISLVGQEIGDTTVE
jgi:hypothetical protein